MYPILKHSRKSIYSHSLINNEDFYSAPSRCAFNYYFPCIAVLCLPFPNVYYLVTPFLYIIQLVSFSSSSSCFPFNLSPNTTSFTSLLSSNPFYRCAQIS